MEHKVLYLFICLLVIKLRVRAVRLLLVSLMRLLPMSHLYLRRDRKEGSKARTTEGLPGRAVFRTLQCGSFPTLLTSHSMLSEPCLSATQEPLLGENHILKDASPDPLGISTASTPSL